MLLVLTIWMRKLGERLECADDVYDLEFCLAAAHDAFLSREHDHGHGAEQCVGRCRRQVQRPGPSVVMQTPGLPVRRP